MGSLYRSTHELVFVFKNGNAPHINNVALGKHGRYQTNVWDYPGVNTFGPNRGKTLEAHSTVKPVTPISDAILDCSLRNGIMVDCFSGSGDRAIHAKHGMTFDEIAVARESGEVDPGSWTVR